MANIQWVTSTMYDQVSFEEGQVATVPTQSFSFMDSITKMVQGIAMGSSLIVGSILDFCLGGSDEVVRPELGIAFFKKAAPW